MDEKSAMEITSDPGDCRFLIGEITRELLKTKGGNERDYLPYSREIALAIIKLQEADYWLLQAMMKEAPIQTKGDDKLREMGLLE